jgi:hypothetical protein
MKPADTLPEGAPGSPVQPTDAAAASTVAAERGGQREQINARDECSFDVAHECSFEVTTSECWPMSSHLRAWHENRLRVTV